MSDLLPFIIVGIASGSVYGLAGVGLVLTYKTSGVFNFAHGALATVAAYVFYGLHVQLGAPWPVAAAVSVVVLGPALGFGFEALARGLSVAALSLRIVATVGALLVVEAGFTILYGSVARRFPPYLPTTTFRILATNVTWGQLIVTIVSVAATASLYVFFRTARLGKAMRAVVDDAPLLALSGTDPTSVRRWAWVIGCVFATLSGILLAPSVNLDPATLTLLVVQAFGAAAIGGFSSLPATWTGGLAIGVAASLVTKYVSSTSILGGLSTSLPFIVLFLVFFIYPKGRLAAQRVNLKRPAIPWRAPARLQGGLAFLVVAFLACVPAFAGFHTGEWTGALTDVILLLSLGMLVRTSGQVSLGHISFAAVGAVAFSKFAVNLHVPWLLALLLAGLVAVPVGGVLAIPAIRLSGLYLALATFGFGLLLQDMFYQSNVMFGQSGLGLSEPTPSLRWLGVGTDAAFYYVVLTLAVLTSVLVVVVTRSRLGRLLRALSDSPTALSVGGTSVNITRVLVFCLSAFIAAIAGALAGVTVTDVTGASYPPLMSLSLLALVIIMPGGEPWYALAGGIGIGVIPAYLTSANTGNWLSVLFGVGAIAVGLGIHSHVPLRMRNWSEKFARKKVPTADRVAAHPAIDKVRPPSVPANLPGGALTVRDVTVRFGGVTAVDHLSLVARTGTITGLIGPNGSGKTTTFNACMGLVRTRGGKVLLDTSDLSRRSPSARARQGLGRTFQLMELYESQTVGENVRLGREAAQAGARILGQLRASPAEHSTARSAAADAMALCGLNDLADRYVATLSTGQRRLVELARCLAGPFRLLLLDEPSSGLDRAETEAFGAILRGVVAERNVGILLVEHDMELVLAICDEVYVLDLGQLLFHGTPSEVRRSVGVRAAYLGDSGVGDVGGIAVPVDSQR